MVEIYTKGEQFTSLLSSASQITSFTRESYAVRITVDNKSILVLAPVNGILYLFGDMDIIEYVVETLWYMNLKIGGICASHDDAIRVVDLFTNVYGGKAKLLLKNGLDETYIFTEEKRKRALFAGGCFWCIAMPFYDVNGVLAVKSGYAGGCELNPTYLEVKHQETHHKECILVEYDASVVDYERILETYFENIDPFDMEGQYIDRGDSYAPCIFTSDKEERNRVIEYKYQLSDECERLCTIPLVDNTVFFMAEEEHQDYAIKNPQKMQEELIASGRIKK